MALGHCGKVSDFVDYCRNIVGTPLAFEGNEATAHGTRTESKARSCYEMIMQVRVHNGGFFASDDGILGASPDGQIVDGTGGSMRLLEIKSPFHALYDASKPAYRPYGIPAAYMCQMQGQMALSNTTLCDFFVYLEKQEPCCVCIRVHRCDAFWAWAEPKIRLVSSWIRLGRPSIVDRSFDFPNFDFSAVRVEPLIPPFNIARQCIINDPAKFPVFAKNLKRPADSVDECSIQARCGIFTLFAASVHSGDTLDLTPEGDEPSFLLVESISWDDGVVRGVPNCCCPRRRDAFGTAVEMSFSEEALQAAVILRRATDIHEHFTPGDLVRKRYKRTIEQDVAVCFVDRDGLVQIPSSTERLCSCVLARGCDATSQSRSNNGAPVTPPRRCEQGSQPVCIGLRDLDEALRVVLNAIECRGIIFVEGGGDLVCWRKPLLDGGKPSGCIDEAFYWAFFVDLDDIVDARAAQGLCGAEHRTPDHAEVMRRALEGDASLVVCVAATCSDAHAAEKVLQLQLDCPHVGVSVGSWLEVVEALHRCTM